MSIKDNLGTVIEDLVQQCPAPGKHAARSALRHISKAWCLKDCDKEMAVFRAITGEEESATAVFHSVMRRKYAGSQQLDVTSHVHKTALHPFLLAVTKVLGKTVFKDGYFPALEFDENETPQRLKTRVTVRKDGVEKWAYPIPPLNFTLNLNGRMHDFADELDDLSSEKKTKGITAYVIRLAKRRNHILYARSNGVPEIANDIDHFLVYRENVIYANLAIYLLIDPYKMHQRFVQQCSDAFIKILPNVRRTMTKT